MTVAITRMERTAAELRRHAACSANAFVARRLLAWALVPRNSFANSLGRPQARGCRAGGWLAETRSVCGWDRQTLCDWEHRYNADGIVGLGDRHGGGAQPRLSPEQEAEVADWIRHGPDVAVDGVVRRRCVDIQARIACLFGVALNERSVGKSGKALALPRLHRLRFARMSTRPRHPKADAAAQASFGPGFAAFVTAALPEAVRVAKTPIEVWHQDEARVGQLAETA